MTVTTIKYQEEYLEALTELAKEFYNKNEYTRGRGWLSEIAFQTILEKSMDTEDIFFRAVLRDNECVGFFLGFSYENKMFNLTIAAEQGFYCQKTIGIKATADIIREFEEWATEQEADFTVLAAMGKTKVGKIYERYGYEISETAYSKPVVKSPN